MINKPVLLVIASEGYQPTEYNEPKKLLVEAGFNVVTASNAIAPAIAKDGSTTPVDVTVADAQASNYSGVFFIGGPGALENLDNEASYTLIRETYRRHIHLGAICVSTRILANSGVLDGKKATGWNGDDKLLELYKEHDIEYVAKPVVVDDQIITAQGPDAAREFGEEIIRVIQESKSWG